jgi:hypothetical protein
MDKREKAMARPVTICLAFVVLATTVRADTIHVCSGESIRDVINDDADAGGLRTMETPAKDDRLTFEKWRTAKDGPRERVDDMSLFAIGATTPCGSSLKVIQAVPANRPYAEAEEALEIVL